MLSTAKPHFEYMKSVWRYTAGMILMAVIYAANTQIDKLAVGSLLSLTNFGYYFLAATVGQAVVSYFFFLDDIYLIWSQCSSISIHNTLCRYLATEYTNC